MDSLNIVGYTAASEEPILNDTENINFSWVTMVVSEKLIIFFYIRDI